VLGLTGRVRGLRYLGDPVLRTRCDEVTAFDRELGRLVDDLLATMKATSGVGLAANQVGVGLRVFVYACPDADGKLCTGHVVNPVLQPVSPAPREVDSPPEGCLSVPGRHTRLLRPQRARVSGVDRRNRPVTVDGTGALARCLHHEVDHLDGVLFVDRMGARARSALLRDFTPPR
jgi:peptide deformylase